MSVDFDLISERTIGEIASHATLYRHVKTGAEVLSLTNDDENKVFGITFRTPPRDSTGLPHILEHSVLAGSQKYPVKEPFVELVKGSLKTFVNALTFPDKTCYPCASQNLKDFYNLIDVYLDAVFHPLLPPRILAQEGWHYELRSLEDPLRYKGVVYNEMKGSYSDPINYLSRISRRLVFPDNSYSFDSGGDPREIPDLLYQDFKSFHEIYYHPSNARIFFSGDDPPQKRLDLINEYLSEFESRAIDSAIELQERYDTPRRTFIKIPAGEGDDNIRRYLVSVNWLLPENKDLELNLLFNILEHTLLGTPGSPLRKAMIDSGLGEDLVNTGLADYLRQLFFSAGLKGVSEEDSEKVEPMILRSLEEIATRGIDHGAISAATNTIEFSMRERNSGGYPRGLMLMFQALSAWLYELDPLERLAYQGPLQAVKDRLAKGNRVLESLIQSHLLENPHRVNIILIPDEEIQAIQQEEESSKLETVRSRMTGDDLRGLVKQNQELERFQTTPDSPAARATIPVLNLEDLDAENQTIPLEFDEISGIQTLVHPLFTDGIVYLDLGFNLRSLPVDDLPLVPLFGRILLESGTQKEDFIKLTQRIGQHTGGIHTRLFASIIREEQVSQGWLFLRAKSTFPEISEMVSILDDILRYPRLDDRDRFRKILLEEKARHESAIIPGGREVVNRRLRAHFNEADWATERMTGLDYLFFLRRLEKNLEYEWESIPTRLEELRSRLLNKAGMVINLTLPKEQYSEARSSLNTFVEKLPAQQLSINEWMTTPGDLREGLVVPSQINFVGKAANLYRLGYTLHGSIDVITNFLRTTWLWDKVRVQGGAYSATIPFGRQSGVISMLSYRDPNLQQTIDIFDRAGEFLQSTEITAEEIRKSIIGAIGAIDAYRLPDAKGYLSLLRFLIKESDETRQKLRDEVLSTSVPDFRKFSETLQDYSRAGLVAVLGSRDALEQAIEAENGRFKLTKVL